MNKNWILPTHFRFFFIYVDGWKYIILENYYLHIDQYIKNSPVHLSI